MNVKVVGLQAREAIHFGIFAPPPLCQTGNAQTDGPFFYRGSSVLSTLHSRPEKGEADDDKVEDAPAISEVVVAQGEHLHKHLRREDDNEPEKKILGEDRVT